MYHTKEVRFDEWCSKCKHADLTEDNMNPTDDCWDCLAEPVNQNTHKPKYFKEKEST